MPNNNEHDGQSVGGPATLPLDSRFPGCRAQSPLWVTAFSRRDAVRQARGMLTGIKIRIMRRGADAAILAANNAGGGCVVRRRENSQ